MSHLHYDIAADDHRRFLAIEKTLRDNPKGSNGKEAGELVARMGCQLIDQVFGELLDALQAHRQSNYFAGSRSVLDELQGVIGKYTPWASGLFGNARLLPVAEHYLALLHPKPAGGDVWLQVPTDAVLHQKIQTALDDAESAAQPDAQALVEILIEVTEVCLHLLLDQPKSLLKFNFVAEKTLNGVISLSKAMAFKQLRKLGSMLQPGDMPIVVGHLRRFVHS